MKIRLLTLLLPFFIITILPANENWINIESIDETQALKSSAKLDVNLSQIEPLNKMMKNVIAIKQLIDATNKKEKNISNDKNWFALNNERSK